MLKKPILGILALAVGVALAAASGPGTAQAQAPAPDVVVEVGSEVLGWVITVTNRGEQTARSVQIRLTGTAYVPPGPTRLLDYWSISTVGNPRGDRIHLYDYDRKNAILHVNYIPPGSSRAIEMGSAGRGFGGRTLVKVRAEVIDVFPKEPETALHNNVAEGWGLEEGSLDGTALGDTSVQVRVSDRFPDPGDSVTFKIKLDNNNGENPDRGWADQNQLRVKVDLSPGLELDSFNPPTNTTFDSATGIWHAGTLKGRTRVIGTRPENKEASVTVKYNGNSPIPAGEHCLTAELVHIIPEELYPETHRRIRDNHRHVCLGDDLPILFQEGEVDLFRVYPCVGRTAYPCNDRDTLELVAGAYEGQLLREDIGIGRVDDDLVPGLNDYVLLNPESIVLQVGDT